jgi:hypothetical protein
LTVSLAGRKKRETEQYEHITYSAAAKMTEEEY